MRHSLNLRRLPRNQYKRAPKRVKSIDRRATASENDRRERLIQLVAIQLTQAELGGTVDEKDALLSDTLLRSTEEIMPGQIPQSHLSGLFEDKAMRAEFEQDWVEREKARTVVRGVLAGGSAFRALRQAYQKLREVMQAVEYRYLEMCAWKLVEFTKAGDVKGWYGHRKGGWRLQGKKVGSAQYIRDDDRKLLRKC